MRVAQTLSVFVLTFSALQQVTLAQSPAKTTEITTPLAATSPTKVPMLVRYNGVAKQSNGSTVEGKKSITFLIYKDAQGGDPVWIETQSVTTDAAGRYELYLGSTYSSGLPADLFGSGEARWLEVQIAGEATQGRTLLTSVPYALKAGDAATLGGLPASAFLQAGSTARAAVAAESASSGAVTPAAAATVVTTTTGGTKGTIPVFTTSNNIENSTLYYNTTGLGIGRFPAAMLDVNGNTVIRGSLDLSRSADATTTTGYPSNPFFFQSSVYNSTSAKTLLPYFLVRSEPTGNNTGSTGATMNFLYYSGVGGAGPQETGLYLNPNGTIHFSSAQTFPGGPGAGTISGVTAGTGLTGGGTTGNVTLNVAVPLQLSGSANGVLEGDDTGSGSGVAGTSPGGYGVSGYSVNNVGVYGSGASSGVTASGGTYGLSSTARNTSGTADGVHTTGANGVYAVSNRAGGNGVYAVAQNGSSSDYAIWGVSNTGFAGVFNGNVSISGTLTKSAGTFKIDHPLDPENKYLSHSFVESPDMMNIYNGIAALDGSGTATVQLPSYFDALNKDYRYQLTAMGAPGPNLYIAEEIANNRFKIAGGKAGMKVSWQVTGVRQDAYANAHRTPVEEDKPGKEKGTYLHPDLFGQPEEKGREWAVHPDVMKREKVDRQKRALGAQAAQ